VKIIQISDLHLDESFIFEDYENMLCNMVDIILNETDTDEKLYVACCGDITDRGNPANYCSSAQRVFEYLKSKLSERSIEFMFVPGNHDICNNEFTDFQSFISMQGASYNFINDNVILHESGDLDFALINTGFHKDIKYGNVDISDLKIKLQVSSKPLIVIMHHTLMSRYSEDRSGLCNAYTFLDELEKHNVIGILHGHTHGFSNIVVGEKCRVIGVGSLFAYIHNCNNQFNVIDINPDGINNVANYRFHFDLNVFLREILYCNKNNQFFGNNVSITYERIKNTVKHRGGISNLCMSITTDLISYQNDMRTFFNSDIEIAKLWLAYEVPPNLYYNHGSYMKQCKKNGIDYVIKELSRNSTSNRAIIPLIRLNDVICKQFEYLPGLVCLQFGFANDDKSELICSAYLRSLEVNRFLRINLSEIYLLIMRISSEIRSIKNINLNLVAFKAQYKEDFSCFVKARIDSTDVGVLAKLIYNRKINELIDILIDKFKVQETVINTGGLEALLTLMRPSNMYSQACIEGLENVIQDMKNLDREYRKNSDYSTIVPMEDRMKERQRALIVELKNSLT